MDFVAIEDISMVLQCSMYQLTSTFLVSAFCFTSLFVIVLSGDEFNHETFLS